MGWFRIVHSPAAQIWGIALLIASVVAVILTTAMRQPPLQGVDIIRNGLLLSSPQGGEAWHPVAFPHSWGSGSKGFGGEVRYKVEFAATPDGRLWCALIPRVNMNASVAVNGTLVGDGGSMEEPVARNWHRPLLICFPSELLKSGKNEAEITVKAFANRFGQLSELYFGPKEIVAGEFKRLNGIYQFVHELTTSVSILLAIIIGFLWWRRRSDAWFWFSLTSLCWGLSGLNVILDQVPVPVREWEWLIQTAIGLVPIFMTFFLHRLQHRRPVGRERLIFSVCLLFSLLLLVAPMEWFFHIADLWHGFSLLVGAYAVWQVGAHYLKSGSREFLIILASMGVILLFAVHDMLVQLGLLPLAGGFLLNFSIPAFLLVVSMLLINQFVAAVTEAEGLNSTLEKRIREAEAELEKNYRQILALEKERAVVDERNRFVRDLHDGLGGLATNINLLAELGRSSESKEKVQEVFARIADLSHEAVAEIRSFMQSLDSSDVDWSTFAADLRRWGTNFVDAHGITLEMSTEIESNLPGPDGSLILNLFRIYREALSNVVKHAQADHVMVTFKVSHDCATLSVADNGVGIGLSPSRGRGLSNMRGRARELGGEAEFISDGHTVVQVTLPLTTPRTMEAMG